MQKTRKTFLGLMSVLGLMSFFTVSTVSASTFTTTTTTGFTTTGYFEQTVYDLNWNMLWFDPNGWKPPLSLHDVIDNGVAWVKKSLLALNASNATDYGTVYRLDLPDIIDANDVYVKVNGRNSNSDDALIHYDFHVYLQGTSGNAEVNFIGSNNMSLYSRLAAGSTLYIDDAGLIKRLNAFEDVGIKIHNGTVSAMVNGQPTVTKNFPENLGKLVQVQLDFRGSAVVNQMEIYEGNNVKVVENFNTNGQSTAKLVVNTGYLFTGASTGTTVTTGIYSLPDPSSYYIGYAPATSGGYALKQLLAKQKADAAYKATQKQHNQPEVVSYTDKGDPINISEGSMTYSQVLMQLPSIGDDFRFAVTYNSALEYPYTPLGRGFDHNYNISLGFNAQDQELYYGYGAGFPLQLDNNGNNSWSSDIVRATVVMQPNNDMRMKFVDGREMFFRPIILGNQELIYRPYLIVDSNGNAEKLTWTTDDILTKIIDATGRSINFTYNSDNKITRVLEAGGRAVEFIYDANKDISRITVNHAGDTKSTDFTYSSGYPQSQDYLNHNMLTIRDAKGQLYVTNTYNTDDEVIQQVYGGDNYSYIYTHDSLGEITSVNVTNGRGVTTAYTVNSDGLITRKVRTTTSGGAEVSSVSYNSDGRMDTYSYPSGKSEHYLYDSLGRVTQKTLMGGSLSQQWSYSYEGDTSHFASITMPNGQTTTFNYDSNYNVVGISQAGVSLGNSTQTLTTLFTYNNKGLLVSSTNAQGIVTSFVYDSLGEITGITQGGDTITRVPDNYGNVISFIDAEGKTFDFDYSNFNQLLQSTTPEGIIQSMAYDNTNNLTENHVSVGGTSHVDSTMTYDILDRLINVDTEQSATSTQQYQWTYHPHDLLATMTAPNGLTSSYDYDHNDHIIRARISDGTTTKEYNYSYNSNGELIKLISPNGAETRWIRDSLGRVIEMIDDHGTQTMISYNQLNQPIQVKVKNLAGTTVKKTEYDYNTLGWTVQKREFTVAGTERTQAGGAIIVYNHSNPQVYTSTYSYNKVGQVKTSTDPKGNTFSFFYDNKGRLFKKVDILGNTTIYEFDGRDLITKTRLVAASGGIYQTSYLYDDDGRLVATTNNDGKSQVYTYNTLNQLIKIRDENGNITDMTYDYVGNVITSTQYLQGNGNNVTAVTTSYEYDIMNNLIALTDAEGNRSEFVYDMFNRMTQEIYPDGKRNIYSYDIMDNVLTTTDPNGTIVSNGYDSLNRLVGRTVALASGVGGVTTEQYNYDELGRLIDANDNLNQDIYFRYDGLDRVVQERNNGKYLHYEYDANSNLTNVIYPSTKELTRDFDSANRLTSMDWAAYNQSINIMDNSYNSLFLLESAFGNQAKSSYSYDNLMRVSGIDHYQSFHPMHSNAGQVIEALDYSYDDVSNVVGDGARDYTLDSLYRMTDALYPPNQAQAIKKEKFQYDLVGNRTQAESWVEKAHGNNASLINNQTTVASSSNNPLVLQQMMVAANGNGGGNAKVTVCHNGSDLEINSSALSSHLAHGDTQGACTGSTTNSGNNTSGNTGNGNNSSSSNGNGNTGTTTSGSTSSGTTQPGGPTYGGAGGTPGMMTYQGTTTYNVNNLNQYTDVTYPRNASQTTTVTYVYDDNGNILQDDKWEYQYDYRNRLIRAEHMQNGEVITFKYDVLNRRTQKTNRSKSRQWIYTFHDVAEENWFMNGNMSAGAIKVREFVYGNGLDDLVYMEQNKPLNYQDEQEEEGYTEVFSGGGFSSAVKRYFFQKDLAGSTKIVSDMQGKVIEMYAYDSFGRIYERNGISGNYRPFQTSRVNHNRFFTNREYDTDLQLYYYRARWYSPALGRFMSRDPLGYSEGPNLYAYVGNNPSTFVDPWGTDKILVQSYTWEGKTFNEMTRGEVLDKTYIKWDWNQFGNAYSESAQEFSQPFVDTAQCFQNDVLVCSAETFTPYGDVVVIQNYIENYDTMTSTQQWVQGGVVLGAVLSPGNSNTNKNLVKKVDDVIEVAQGLNKKIDWSKINTYGMIKPKEHYQKHGIDDLVNNGIAEVSPQKYFNDAKKFSEYALENKESLNTTSVTIKSLNNIQGYKIKDPKTGMGGFFGPNGEIVSFRYN